MLQLFAFVKADISARQAKLKPAASASASTTTEPSASSSTPAALDLEPGYPKSLFLVQPLHARPLRPIPQAQVPSPVGSSRIIPTLKRLRARVPVPEGLDLDAWIVPPPKSAVRHAHGDEDDDDNTPVVSAKRRKGKDKADGTGTDGKTKGKKKKVKEGAGAESAGAGGESAEEIAARARVCHLTHSIIVFMR